MRKVYYNCWIANVFLFAAHTITLGPFVLTKKSESELKQNIINHECTHARQWIELTISAGIILLGLVLAFDISACWMLISGMLFYAWYILEWFVRLVAYKVIGINKDAYEMISFEREAYGSEDDCNYLENCRYFCGWLKYVFK